MSTKHTKPLITQDVPHSLVGDEGLLLRLFRCLPPADKDEVLLAIGQKAMRRFSVDSHHKKPWVIGDDEMAPERIENFDDRLMGACPGDWPGRLIELDDMGDAGAFLAEAMPDEAVAIIFGTSDNDESVAEALADVFVAQAEKKSIPLPSDFGASTEEVMRDTKDDFVRFIRAWREHVVQTIEKHACKGAAE